MAVKHKYLNLFFALAPLVCFSQNMPPSTKPDPAHIGPLAPDPRIKQHVRKEQDKLSEIVATLVAPPEKPKSAVRIIDPNIPGIHIIRYSDPEFEKLPDTSMLPPSAFAIKNESKHAIVSLGSSYRIAGKPYTCYADGISTDINVPTGATVTIAPFWQKASNTEEGCNAGFSYDKDPTEGFITFLMFDNGDFYGGADWEQNIREKSSLRKRFFREASGAKDYSKFIEEFKPDKGADSESFEEIKNEYEALVKSFHMDPVDFLRLNRRLADRFPTIGKVTRLASTAALLSPMDGVDGYFASSVYANCGSGSPGFNGTVNTGCQFPLNSDGDLVNPTGALLSTTPTGFWARYAATCNQPIGSQGVYIEDYVHDEFSTLIPRPGTPPAEYFWQPRENIYTKYRPIYTSGAGPDRFELSIIAGIPEPFGPLANADGGGTACRAEWINTLNAGRIGQIDLLQGGSTGVILSVNQATLVTKVHQLPYGYALANRKQTKYCNQTLGPNISYFLGVGTKQGPPNSPGYLYTEYTACTHVTPGQQAANRCDPNTDFCCCMAAFNNLSFCIARMPDESSIGQFPGSIPSCGYTGAGVGAEAVIASRGQVFPNSAAESGDTGQIPDHIGVFRANNSYFMTDPTGTNAYQAGDTRIQSFIPPGGIQSGDVPVSGDWSGTGHARVGFYRSSTGTWYVDANGNGIWDGVVTGGDLTYQFGGVQSSGTPNTTGFVPGDIPVVGDWQGGGQSCIGVFRYGYYWILDTNCNGVFDGGDTGFSFGGIIGDVPVVGKWAGTSVSQVGVVRCYVGSNGLCAGPPAYWIMDIGAPMNPYQWQHSPGQGYVGCNMQMPYYYSECRTPAPFWFGGLSGDVYLSGDWLGTGVSYPGIYRSGQWIMDTDFTGTKLNTYNFGGLSGDVPLVGKW